MSSRPNKPRPPKKTVSVEARISEERKQAFLDACRKAGRPASEVIRELMAIFVIVQNVKWRVSTMIQLFKPVGAALASVIALAGVGVSLVMTPMAAADGRLASRLVIMDGVGEQAPRIVAQGGASLDDNGVIEPITDTLGDNVYEVNARRCADNADEACPANHIFVMVDLHTRSEGVERQITAASLILEPGAETRFATTLADGRTLTGHLQAFDAE